MPLKRRPIIKVPQSTVAWNFRQSASPIIGTGGNNLTFGGTNTFTGDSVITSLASGYFQSAAGKFGKLPCFTMFLIMRPINTDEFADLWTLGSGSGGSADDYTWYIINGAGASGFLFGVSPGGGDYGSSVFANAGAIDTTKKYKFMLGYNDTPAANLAFIFAKKDGDPNIYQGYSNTMSQYQSGRNHLFSNTPLSVGGSVSCEYGYAEYWENQYLQDLSIFQALCEDPKRS